MVSLNQLNHKFHPLNSDVWAYTLSLIRCVERKRKRVYAFVLNWLSKGRSISVCVWLSLECILLFIIIIITRVANQNTRCVAVHWNKEVKSRVHLRLLLIANIIFAYISTFSFTYTINHIRGIDRKSGVYKTEFLVCFIVHTLFP